MTESRQLHVKKTQCQLQRHLRSAPKAALTNRVHIFPFKFLSIKLGLAYALTLCPVLEFPIWILSWFPIRLARVGILTVTEPPRFVWW